MKRQEIVGLVPDRSIEGLGFLSAESHADLVNEVCLNVLVDSGIRTLSYRPNSAPVPSASRPRDRRPKPLQERRVRDRSISCSLLSPSIAGA